MKKSTGIKKLLFMVLVLTPLAAVQSLMGAYFIMLFTGNGQIMGDDIFDMILPVIIFGAILIGANWLVLLIRFSSQDSIIYHILEFLISPLRLPLQLVSDVLAIVALFKDIDVCPRNEPVISVDGFWDAFLIFTLEYQPGGKEDSQDMFDRKERARERRRATSRGKRISSSLTNSQSSAPTDNRRRDNGIFTNALEKEIESRIIYSNLNGIPCDAAVAYDVSWESKYLDYQVTSKKVILSGTLHLQSHTSDTYIINNALSSAKSRTESHLRREVKNCIENVRNEYQGYDQSWEIDIRINAKYSQY